MSATGRGERGGIGVDFFSTPPWCVHRLLDREWDRFAPATASNKYHWLEPTAGDGSIIKAVDEWLANEHPLQRKTIKWDAVELRKGTLYGVECERVNCFGGVDYRAWIPRHRYALGLGNPPFSIAQSIVARALTQCTALAMLLRLGFLGSAERLAFWKENPAAVRVLPDRVSFDGEGCDSDYVAWFMWGFDDRTIEVLDSTPVGVRRAAAQDARLALIDTPATQTRLSF